MNYPKLFMMYYRRVLRALVFIVTTTLDVLLLIRWQLLLPVLLMYKEPSTVTESEQETLT